MSQLVSAKEARILAPEGDVLKDAGTEEVLEAIEAMQANLVVLIAKLNLTVANTSNQRSLTDVQDQVAILSKTVNDLATTLKKRTPKKWTFKIRKDSFGEMIAVDAIQID